MVRWAHNVSIQKCIPTILLSSCCSGQYWLDLTDQEKTYPAKDRKDRRWLSTDLVTFVCSSRYVERHQSIGVGVGEVRTDDAYHRVHRVQPNSSSALRRTAIQPYYTILLRALYARASSRNTHTANVRHRTIPQTPQPPFLYVTHVHGTLPFELGRRSTDRGGGASTHRLTTASHRLPVSFTCSCRIKRKILVCPGVSSTSLRSDCHPSLRLSCLPADHRPLLSLITRWPGLRVCVCVRRERRWPRARERVDRRTAHNLLRGGGGDPTV